MSKPSVTHPYRWHMEVVKVVCKALGVPYGLSTSTAGHSLAQVILNPTYGIGEGRKTRCVNKPQNSESFTDQVEIDFCIEGVNSY